MKKPRVYSVSVISTDRERNIPPPVERGRLMEILRDALDDHGLQSIFVVPLDPEKLPVEQARV